MQSHSWLAFFIHDPKIETAVHFFPSSGAVGAPYLSHCKFSIFGNGIKNSSVVIEGARLSHPDGLWLKDAFPKLKQSPQGLFGLEIEVMTNQPRVLLAGSGCIIEVCSDQGVTRFVPVSQKKGATEPEVGGGMSIKDPFCTTSIVAVNPTESILNPEIDAVHHGQSERKGELSGVGFDRVAPRSAQELALEPLFYESGFIRECSWGLARGRRLQRSSKQSPSAAYYTVYRSGREKFPISVGVL